MSTKVPKKGIKQKLKLAFVLELIQVLRKPDNTCRNER